MLWLFVYDDLHLNGLARQRVCPQCNLGSVVLWNLGVISTVQNIGPRETETAKKGPVLLQFYTILLLFYTFLKVLEKSSKIKVFKKRIEVHYTVKTH